MTVCGVLPVRYWYFISAGTYYMAVEAFKQKARRVVACDDWNVRTHGTRILYDVRVCIEL